MRHQYGSTSNRLFYPPKWIKCDVALRKRGGGRGGKGGGKEGGLEGTWLTFLLIKMSHLDFINPFNPKSD